MQDALMESVRESRELARLNGFKQCQSEAMQILYEILKPEPLGRTYDLLSKAFSKISELNLEPLN